MIKGPGNVWVERGGQLDPAAKPFLDARLGDGSRIAISAPPTSREVVITIRRFRRPGVLRRRPRAARRAARGGPPGRPDRPVVPPEHPGLRGHGAGQDCAAERPHRTPFRRGADRRESPCISRSHLQPLRPPSTPSHAQQDSPTSDAASISPNDWCGAVKGIRASPTRFAETPRVIGSERGARAARWPPGPGGAHMTGRASVDALPNTWRRRGQGAPPLRGRDFGRGTPKLHGRTRSHAQGDGRDDPLDVGGGQRDRLLRGPPRSLGPRGQDPETRDGRARLGSLACTYPVKAEYSWRDPRKGIG